MSLFKSWAAIAAIGVLASSTVAPATPYTVSMLSGGNWQTLYVQGFNTQLGASPNPGVSVGSTVTLSSFEFFKSGTADTASNIRLAILNNIFPNSPTVTNMTSTSPTVVGLSTNTIASTAPLNTGDSELFTFNNLPLIYGNDYAAVFVNVGTDVGSGAPLTPIRVSALAANYVDDGTGTFHPIPNYGTESQFNYATSNFINGGFFSTFSFAGDALFRATLNAVPEPASATLALAGGLAMACVFRWRRHV
jgi:hypothetical protein